MNTTHKYLLAGAGVIALIALANKAKGVPAPPDDTKSNLQGTGIKCCTSRDKYCKCLTWKWAASKDCDNTPCGGAVNVGLHTSSNLISIGHYCCPEGFALIGGKCKDGLGHTTLPSVCVGASAKAGSAKPLQDPNAVIFNYAR